MRTAIITVKVKEIYVVWERPANIRHLKTMVSSQEKLLIPGKGNTYQTTIWQTTCWILSFLFS